MEISYETKVSLYPLEIHKEKKYYILENITSGDFYEMPKICIAAIDMINNNKPLNKIEQTLIADFPDEDINLLEFVNQLFELNLVSELNGEKVVRDFDSKNESGFTWIPEGLGHFFFNRFSTGIYIAFMATSILLILLKPDLFPSYSDLFVFDLMIKNVIAWMGITFLLVLLHEFGHVLAVRSEGLPARIELGHRLFLLVLETDMSQAWKLKAEKRNKLYLAGMHFDSAVLFLALLGQFFAVGNSITIGLLKLFVLDTFIRLVYQAAVFMKTDLYYVMENKMGCYNLMENGRNFLARWLPFLSVPQTETFAGEEKFVRTYAGFYLSGILLTLFITAYYYIPQMIFVIKEIMVPGFMEPISSLRFWDSVVFLLQIVIVLGLLLYSWTKKYRYSS